MNQIVNLYFSPTGNAKKIGSFAGEVLSEKWHYPIEAFDMTAVNQREKLPILDETDFLIVTMPVYAGRLPNKIMPVLKDMIEGRNTRVLAMITYGNRAYDDALSELCLLLTENGFLPIAAVAFPGEHAFSAKLAKGRPNDEDLEALRRFLTWLPDNFIDLRSLPVVDVPGNKPPGPYYSPLGKNGLPAIFLKAKPKTNLELCVNCGSCARRCPMAAIDDQDVSMVPGTCIKCHSCVRNCPTNAKYFDDAMFLSHVAMLEDYAAERKEITFFMSDLR